MAFDQTEGAASPPPPPPERAAAADGQSETDGRNERRNETKRRHPLSSPLLPLSVSLTHCSIPLFLSATQKRKEKWSRTLNAIPRADPSVRHSCLSSFIFINFNAIQTTMRSSRNLCLSGHRTKKRSRTVAEISSRRRGASDDFRLVKRPQITLIYSTLLSSPPSIRCLPKQWRTKMQDRVAAAANTAGVGGADDDEEEEVSLRF